MQRFCRDFRNFSTKSYTVAQFTHMHLTLKRLHYNAIPLAPTVKTNNIAPALAAHLVIKNMKRHETF